jgi:hypothetical protein
MCKKTTRSGTLKFELCHTFARLVKSAIFAPVSPFFFPSELSKMQIQTFIKQKTNK